MSHYLVTGGAGFIGTNIVKKLLVGGHQVRVIDNYAGGKKSERFQAGAEYLEGDIRNREDLDKACVGVDGIFHLAALPRVPFSVEHPWETHDVNVNGTLNVLMAAKENKIKRVVFSSSSSTYGAEEKNLLQEDSVIKKPISPYALHKFIGEHYCRLFSELYGLETVSLIYFNVYGPYFDPDGAYALVVGKFLKQKKEGKPMTVCGDGEYYRDYTHVADVVRANLLAMHSPMVGGAEIINIGTGRNYSMWDVARMMLGKNPDTDPKELLDAGLCKLIADRRGEARISLADISKAKRLLDWEPKINLKIGLKQLLGK